jgi:transcriptional regulator with PAS, ATPase and Fis domain
MKDGRKTRDQLIKEMEGLRRRVSELEASDERHIRLVRSLERSHEFLQSVLESIEEPIVVMDRARELRWMNRAAQDILFDGASYLKYLKCYKCFHRMDKPCDPASVPCPAFKVLKSGKPSSAVHEHFMPDGEKRFFEITASPLADGEGIIIGFVESMRDVTGRRRREEEREGLIGELQKALSEVKALRGLIPICAWCKKVRDDKGFWESVEKYIEDHSDAHFTHGICPECLKELKEKEGG